MLAEVFDKTVPDYILKLLPSKIAESIRRFEAGKLGGVIEEIRIRCERNLCITSDGINYRLNITCHADEIEQIIAKLCDGSLYAHSETIKNGYIALKSGVRVGICGRASYDRDGMLGVSDISSLCIRIPHVLSDVGEELCRLISKNNKGMLIYAPPGEGKTTLLRSIAARLSSGISPKRVALVDTRGELSYSLDRKDLCLDVLSGYSRSEGIEIAARTLSAQIIICDEIGGYEEAESIVMAHNCGVPLIASAHASSVEELMHKPAILYMFRCGIFDDIVGIRREYTSSSQGFSYKITCREELYDTYGRF